MIRAYETELRDSTVGILGRIIRSDVALRRDVLGQDNTRSEDVAISVRLVGDPGGMLLVRMHTATAVKICSRLHETIFKSITPIAADTLLELANMIAGNVVCILNSQGFDFALSIPHLGIRENSDVNSRNLGGLSIPLMTDCGDVTVQLALKTH